MTVALGLFPAIQKQNLRVENYFLLKKFGRILTSKSGCRAINCGVNEIDIHWINILLMKLILVSFVLLILVREGGGSLLLTFVLTSYATDACSDLRFIRKPTHTNLYLNPTSHHHLSNIQTVLSTFVHRARALCEKEATIIWSCSRPFSVKMCIVWIRYDVLSARR